MVGKIENQFVEIIICCDHRLWLKYWKLRITSIFFGFSWLELLMILKLYIASQTLKKCEKLILYVSEGWFWILRLVCNAPRKSSVSLTYHQLLALSLSGTWQLELFGYFVAPAWNIAISSQLLKKQQNCDCVDVRKGCCHYGTFLGLPDKKPRTNEGSFSNYCHHVKHRNRLRDHSVLFLFSVSFTSGWLCFEEIFFSSCLFLLVKAR